MGGSVCATAWILAIHRDSYMGKRCWYCGVELLEWPKGSFTSDLPLHRNRVVDHKLPRVRGGTDDADNLVDACVSCNSSKGKRTVEEFRQYVYKRTSHGAAQTHLIAALQVFMFHQADAEAIAAIAAKLSVDFPRHVFYGEQPCQA